MNDYATSSCPSKCPDRCIGCHGHNADGSWKCERNGAIQEKKAAMRAERERALAGIEAYERDKHRRLINGWRGAKK